jgi:hypothetical protein
MNFNLGLGDQENNPCQDQEGCKKGQDKMRFPVFQNYGSQDSSNRNPAGKDDNSPP